jgi:NAD(P)-dependent dehydrogenase (short-subunit alcohol dehydrogenase family)
MGKVWFITGATRGIGAEVVKAALAAGERVVATGRRPEHITGAFGMPDRLLSVALDVTVEWQATAAVDAAFKRFGRIDVVVNNAGFAVLGAVEEVSDAEVRQQFDTNVFGLLNVTRAVLPILRVQRSGHILNLSSIAGIGGAPGGSSYSGSKFAVEGISECLNAELAPLGIDVTLVEPGFFRTGFLSSDSVVYAERVIGAYAATSGATRELTAAMHLRQSGDPKKARARVAHAAAAERPPRRFVAGADAVGLFEEALSKRSAELNAWRNLSLSLAYEDSLEASTS